MIRLDFRHLEMIEAIDRAGSVSAAAEHLGVSQSALSHRIREAERRLDTQLFFRENRRLVLTTAGKRLCQAGAAAMREVEQAEREVEQLAGGVRQVVRLGAISYTPLHWLPDLIDRMEAEGDRLEIEVTAEPVFDPVQALGENLFDLALVSGGGTSREVDISPVRRDRLVVLMAEDHLLGDKNSLAPEDFTGVTYIAHHTLPERGREYELFFRRHDVLPARVIQAGTADAVAELVRHGIGVTIMPAWATTPHLRLPGLVAVPLGPEPMQVDWKLMMRRSEAAGSATRRIARLITDLVRP